MYVYQNYDLNIGEFYEYDESLESNQAFHGYRLRLGGDKPIKLIICQSAETRTFDNIEQFYRRPVYFQLQRDETLAQKIDPLTSYPRIRAFFHGFSLLLGRTQGQGDWLWSDYDVNKPYEPAFIVGVYVDLYEMGASTDKVLLSSDYFTVQSFNDVVVGCYQPPCLSDFDEFYLQWQHSILEPCLKTSLCSALEDRLKNVRKSSRPQQIIIKEFHSEKGTPGLTVMLYDADEEKRLAPAPYGGQSYRFWHNVNLRLFKYGEKDVKEEPSWIFFENMKTSKGDIIVVMYSRKGEEKLFKTVDSPMLKEGETVRNLDFYYQDLPEGLQLTPIT
jgi:hypothetical protein